MNSSTSTYLLLKSTCEFFYVDVSALNLCLKTYLRRRIFSQCPLWSLLCRRLFILLKVLRRRSLSLCRHILFSFQIECRRIWLVRRPVLVIFSSVSAYVRISVDVHPKRIFAVSTYLLHTSTCIQQLWNVCRRIWFLCWLKLNTPN